MERSLRWLAESSAGNEDKGQLNLALSRGCTTGDEEIMISDQRSKTPKRDSIWYIDVSSKCEAWIAMVEHTMPFFLAGIVNGGATIVHLELVAAVMTEVDPGISVVALRHPSRNSRPSSCSSPFSPSLPLSHQPFRAPVPFFTPYGVSIWQYAMCILGSHQAYRA